MLTSRRPKALLDSALATGALATIATGGALIGLGIREGESSRVFRLVGRTLLERIGVASAAAPLTSVAVGYLHHLIVATGWGVVLGMIVLALRGPVRLFAALLATVAYGLIALWFMPPVIRIGFSVTNNVASVVPIGVALLVALLGGVWLAASDSGTQSSVT